MTAAPGAGRSFPRPSTAEKLDQVLAVSAGVIARNGFGATSIRDVAEALDMSVGGLYHYFSGKEDLLYQIQHRTFEALRDRQLALAAEPGEPEDRFRRLLIGHLEFFTEHPNELKVCTYELESLPDRQYEAVEALRRDYYLLMAKVVTEVMAGPDGAPASERTGRHASLFIFGMLNWIFMWYDPARHGTVEQIGREMVSFALNGLRGGDRGGMG